MCGAQAALATMHHCFWPCVVCKNLELAQKFMLHPPRLSAFTVSPGSLRIDVQEREGLGRGLVSLGAEPEEVLLSLPFDSVFMDTEVAITPFIICNP